MRQFPLSELDIAPGRVVEWRPRSGKPLAPADSGVPRRNASFNQEKHFSSFEEARRANEPIASWLAVTFDVEGPFDQAAMESALLHFTRRHEVLRCEFRRLTGDLSCELIDPSDIGLDTVDMGCFDSTREIREYLADSFRKNTDTVCWPLFVMGAVIRDEGSSTVYLAFNHIVSDGASMPNVVNDIQTAYAALAQGREIQLPPAEGYLDFAHEQRSRYLSIGADDECLGYWKRFIARNGEFFPRFPLDLGITPGRMYQAVNEAETLLDPAGAQALEARCREAGGGLFMGVLAAMAVALRECGGPEVYRGFMPVSERGRSSYAHSMGWFVNTLPIEFPVRGGTNLTDMIAGVRAGFSEMMENGEVPFVRAWELLAPDLFTHFTWPYPVNFFSYLDMRKFAGSEHYQQWRPSSHVWSSSTNGVCSWFQRDANGLHANSIYADTLQARRTMTLLQDTLRETLLELSRSGRLPGPPTTGAPTAQGLLPRQSGLPTHV